jgi:hypothetical protein
MAKDKAPKPDKGKKREAAPAGPPGLTLAGHPRAQHQIRAAKAWAGLLGFVLVTVLSRRAGLPLADALGRGVLGGVAANLATWAAMVLVWRQLAVAELEVARRRLVAQLAAREAEAPETERG